jgi:galactoside O-acetyltransferase
MKRRRNEGMAPEHIKPVIIEDDVWICAFTLINKGVRIGKGAVIGAGSIVTKDIPSFCIAAGNPARVLREITTSHSDSDPS